MTNNHYNKSLKPFANKLRKEMTKAEACLWKYVLRAGMMKGYTFRRQRPVLNYIADFMCAELKLVIEVDGITHNFDEVIAKDKDKEDNLKAIGVSVLRFNDNDVLTQIEGIRRTIEAYIEKGGFAPPNPRRQGK